MGVDSCVISIWSLQEYKKYKLVKYIYIYMVRFRELIKISV
jgi:hypothetical protein